MNFLYTPVMVLTSATLIASTLMAMSSANWILLWAAMELNMLSFIPIILQYSFNQEVEASIKYYMAQAFGSALLLMSSISMWMPFTSLPNIFPLILTGAVLLKLGSVPCHFWYPSVMNSISWMSCLILSTWQKLAPLSILVFLVIQKNSIFIMLVAAMNALVGGIMGMNQTRMRAIMAYSSIGHIGWMVGLATIFKPYASIMYFCVYSVMIIPLFISMWMFNINTSKQMNKLSAYGILTQMAVATLLLSLGGLPPLTGFMPKLMTIMLLMETKNIIMFLLIAGSIMNLFFYLSIIINLMLNMPSTRTKQNKTMNNNPVPLIMASMTLGLSPFIFMYAMILFYQP